MLKERTKEGVRVVQEVYRYWDKRGKFGKVG